MSKGIVTVLALASANVVLAQALPANRTVDFAIVEYKPVPLCNLARNSKHVFLGTVLSVGSVVEIPSTATRSGGLFTEVTIVPTSTLKGTVSSPITVLVFGSVAASGKFDEGSLRDAMGNLRVGYFFLSLKRQAGFFSMVEVDSFGATVPMS